MYIYLWSCQGRFKIADELRYVIFASLSYQRTDSDFGRLTITLFVPLKLNDETLSWASIIELWVTANFHDIGL